MGKSFQFCLVHCQGKANLRIWFNELVRKCLSPITDTSNLFQGECETFYLNRFMAAYNSTREAWALHMPLKEYAANILV